MEITPHLQRPRLSGIEPQALMIYYSSDGDREHLEHPNVRRHMFTAFILAATWAGATAVPDGDVLHRCFQVQVRD